MLEQLNRIVQTEVVKFNFVLKGVKKLHIWNERYILQMDIVVNSI